MAPGKKIAVIGAGNMGEALIAGMLAARAAVPGDIHATDVAAARLDQVKARYGILVGTDNKAAAGWSDIVLLAVEPQVMDHVLDDLLDPEVERPQVRADDRARDDDDDRPLRDLVAARPVDLLQLAPGLADEAEPALRLATDARLGTDGLAPALRFVATAPDGPRRRCGRCTGARGSRLELCGAALPALLACGTGH